MTKWLNILRAFVPLAFLGCNAALAAPPVHEVVPIEIGRVEFGLFEPGDANATVFSPSAVVPHRQGQRYGWMIEVLKTPRSLSVREEYVIPQAVAPGRQGAEQDSLNVPVLRRNQVSQRQLVPVDGIIYGEWAIGPAEPAGHRHLQVVIEERAVVSFEFDVQ